jgi:hypothetical protein
MGSSTGEIPTLPSEQTQRTFWSKMGKIICTIISAQWIELWDKRMGKRHGIDSTAKAIALKEQAIREMEILYTY